VKNNNSQKGEQSSRKDGKDIAPVINAIITILTKSKGWV
jgi:hypothetical protein